MITNPKYLLVSIYTLIALAACAVNGAAENQSESDLVLWDQIVTPELFQSLAAPGEFSRYLEHGKLVYVFVYQPSENNSDHIWSVATEVSTAGALLKKVDYERDLASSSANTQQQDFPKIGARAQVTPVFFGPDGDSHGLVSTTEDELFDLKINVLQSSTENDADFIDPIDPINLSLRLHEEYKALNASNGTKKEM